MIKFNFLFTSSSNSSPFNTLEGNKHKCIQKLPLESVEITKSKFKEIENLFDSIKLIPILKI